MDNGARIIMQEIGLDMQYFLGNCSGCWNNSLRRAQLSSGKIYSPACSSSSFKRTLLRGRWRQRRRQRRCIGRTKRPKELRKPPVRLVHGHNRRLYSAVERSSLRSRVALKRRAAPGHFRTWRVRIKLTRTLERCININIVEDGREDCGHLTHRREWKLNYRRR